MSLNLTWIDGNQWCSGTYPLRPDALVECAEWCPETCVDSGFD
ncbi:hypothetical protein [Myxococcus sp. CA033]|nr:hypothetical protein [Myxococcus sp. CA033]